MSIFILNMNLQNLEQFCFIFDHCDHAISQSLCNVILCILVYNKKDTNNLPGVKYILYADIFITQVPFNRNLNVFFRNQFQCASVYHSRLFNPIPFRNKASCAKTSLKQRLIISCLFLYRIKRKH